MEAFQQTQEEQQVILLSQEENAPSRGQRGVQNFGTRKTATVGNQQSVIFGKNPRTQQLIPLKTRWVPHFSKKEVALLKKAIADQVVAHQTLMFTSTILAKHAEEDLQACEAEKANKALRENEALREKIAKMEREISQKQLYLQQENALLKEKLKNLDKGEAKPSAISRRNSYASAEGECPKKVEANPSQLNPTAKPFAPGAKRRERSGRSTKTVLCRFHQRGLCKFGEKCRFKHCEDDAATGSEATANTVTKRQQPATGGGSRQQPATGGGSPGARMQRLKPAPSSPWGVTKPGGGTKPKPLSNNAKKAMESQQREEQHANLDKENEHCDENRSRVEKLAFDIRRNEAYECTKKGVNYLKKLGEELRKDPRSGNPRSGNVSALTQQICSIITEIHGFPITQGLRIGIQKRDKVKALLGHLVQLDLACQNGYYDIAYDFWKKIKTDMCNLLDHLKNVQNVQFKVQVPRSGCDCTQCIPQAPRVGIPDKDVVTFDGAVEFTFVDENDIAAEDANLAAGLGIPQNVGPRVRHEVVTFDANGVVTFDGEVTFVAQNDIAAEDANACAGRELMLRNMAQETTSQGHPGMEAWSGRRMQTHHENQALPAPVPASCLHQRQHDNVRPTDEEKWSGQGTSEPVPVRRQPLDYSAWSMDEEKWSGITSLEQTANAVPTWAHQPLDYSAWPFVQEKSGIQQLPAPVPASLPRQRRDNNDPRANRPRMQPAEIRIDDPFSDVHNLSTEPFNALTAENIGIHNAMNVASTPEVAPMTENSDADLIIDYPTTENQQNVMN